MISKCLTDPLTLTVDLQADCDVHGACYIHCRADICPRILWDGSFNVQTAITPQEHPPVQLNLCRRKNTAVTQKRRDHLYCKMLNTRQSYRFSIMGPVSFWERYSIQQHAGNTQGLTDASGDDRGTLGQERGLCGNRTARNTEQKQENVKVF